MAALLKILAMVTIIALLIMTLKMKNHYEISTDPKEESNFVYTIDEKKYADYTFCGKRENLSQWKDLYLESDEVESENSFLPKNLEESPVGKAPSIPKEFLREEADFCSRNPKLKAIAIVHSAIKNVARRSITRQTWGNASDEMGVIFVMGRTSTKEEEDIVANESHLHHDIVQGNYTDHYKFLPYSSLNAFYWMTKNCEHVQWIVKADDDSLLDVKKYLYFIDIYKNASNFSEKIFCEFACDHHAERNRTKWTISEQEYPYKDYPSFCQGTMWLTSIHVLKSLLNVVPLVKYVWIDDIYVTGILTMKANIPRYRIKIPIGNFSHNDIGKLMAWSQLESSRLDLWNDITKFYNPNYPSAFFDDLSGN